MGPQPVEDENFCLRWNDYEKKYAETFRTLREDEHFADVTLACEGHAVKAHRIILCACSGYFGHILRTINPAQVGCIVNIWTWRGFQHMFNFSTLYSCCPM